MKVVIINAIWCSGCIVMKKVWKEIMELYPNIETLNLDYDFDEEEVMPYNPGKILPVAIFFYKDKEVARLNGEKTVEEIRLVLDDVYD